MSMYDDFETSPELEAAGVWLDRAEYRIQIAHAGGTNSEFVKAFERATKPHRNAMSRGKMNEAVAEKILIECYAKHVIKDWNVLLVERDKDGQAILDERKKTKPVFDKDGNLQWQRGIHARDGTVLKYSVDTVSVVLKNLPKLFSEIRNIAEEYSNYLESVREEDSKN